MERFYNKLNRIGTEWIEEDANTAIQYGCDPKCYKKAIQDATNYGRDLEGWVEYPDRVDRCVDSCPEPISIDRPAARDFIINSANFVL